MASKDTNILEANIVKFTSELTEIKSLLQQSRQLVVKQKSMDNIWFNKDKLESTNASPESFLVVNNSTQFNKDSLEKSNCGQFYSHNSGDTVLGCDSVDTSWTSWTS